LPPLACPHCKGSVVRLPREAGVADYFMIGFADLPFWLLFGACATLGMKNWAAGIVSASLVGFLYFAWHRCQSKYRCCTCRETFKYSQVVER